MGKKMEKAHIIGRMDLNMLDNGKIIKLTDM